MIKLKETLRRLTERLSSHSKNNSHSAYYNAMQDVVSIYGDANGSILITKAFPNTTEIGENAHQNNTTVKLAVIPPEVDEIGDYSFDGCTALEKVILPQGMVYIEPYAFRGCSNLSDIVIPNSILRIGSGAFSGCTSFEEITLPDTLTYFGADVFSGCNSLMSATIPALAGGFIRTSTVQNLTVTSGNIDQKRFYSTDSLKNVTIGNGVRSIGYMAFASCENLDSVTIGSGVNTIGSSAFYNCGKLTSATIKDGVRAISDGAFQKCSSLTGIQIPASVSRIAYDVFSQCNNLANIYVPWNEGKVDGAPWGAANATVHYNTPTLSFSLAAPTSVVNKYDFVLGMTWEDWCNSDYNTIGAFVDSDGDIIANGYDILYGVERVKNYERILENTQYSLWNGQ